MILWLDDERKPWQHGYHNATWAKTYNAAIGLLQTGRVTFASLDHDLSERASMGEPEPGEKTGMDVVLWMKENSVWPVDGVRVHSLNRQGKKLMEHTIRTSGGKLIRDTQPPAAKD